MKIQVLMRILISEYFIFLLIVSQLVTSCASFSSLYSVVDNQNPQTYKKVLIVFCAEPKYFEYFMLRFETSLEAEFSKYDAEYEFYSYEPEPINLELNSNNSPIPSSKFENKDLFIFIQPRNITMTYNSAMTFNLEAVGTSIEDKKEVWKLWIESIYDRGTDRQSEVIVQAIFSRLAKDGLINTKNEPQENL
jgi:hypothetical protein